MRSIVTSMFVCILLVLVTFSSAWIQNSMTSMRLQSSALRATTETNNNQAQSAETNEPVTPKVWPRNRPPTPNVKLLTDKMDATWGRGKFRAEVWSGEDNPEDDWTDKYSPSEEELEAMLYGFDFTNARQQLEVNDPKKSIVTAWLIFL